MAEDSDFFLRRNVKTAVAASSREDSESAEVAGYLALAHAALARRRKAPLADGPGAVDPVVASVADEIPMMLRD